MTTKELLKEIRRDNKKMIRSIQQLSNIGLMGILMNVARIAKEQDDETGKTIVKVGLALVVLSEVLVLISEIIDCRKAKVEDETEVAE